MRYVILLLVIFLASCHGVPMNGAGVYPAEIRSFEELGNFPVSAAGYIRGKMYAYEPGMINYSVAYDIHNPEIQNSVTLYFYEAPISLMDLFEMEKQNIARAHGDARLLRQYSTALEKDGVSYQAYVATFSFSGVFARRKQNLFSQLMVVSHPARFFKLRSTAPIDHAELVEARNLQLLDAVNWAY